MIQFLSQRFQKARQSLGEYRPTSLQGIHWLAQDFYRAQGYHWEVRRSGDVKLGYWRKSLRPKNQRSPYPKRFVLIPGFGDTPLSWHAVILLLHFSLKKNYDEVILLDFPGFGGFLSRERAFPSLDLMVTAVADTLDSLKPHTLLGHSLGGWLASYYAGMCGMGQRPLSNRLNFSGPSQLIVVNPSGIYSSEAVMKQSEAIIKSSLGLMEGSASEPSERLARLRPHLFAKEPRWFGLIAAHFKQFLAREDIAHFVQSARGDQHLLNSCVKNVQSKTWVIWGEKDTLVPASCAPAWLECLTSGNIKSFCCGVILPAIGHSPQLEAPWTTALVIGQILAGQVPHRLGRRWWKLLEQGLTEGH